MYIIRRKWANIENLAQQVLASKLAIVATTFAHYHNMVLSPAEDGKPSMVPMVRSTMCDIGYRCAIIPHRDSFPLLPLQSRILSSSINSSAFYNNSNNTHNPENIGVGPPAECLKSSSSCKQQSFTAFRLHYGERQRRY